MPGVGVSVFKGFIRRSLAAWSSFWLAHLNVLNPLNHHHGVCFSVDISNWAAPVRGWAHSFNINPGINAFSTASDLVTDFNLHHLADIHRLHDATSSCLFKATPERSEAEALALKKEKAMERGKT